MMIYALDFNDQTINEALKRANKKTGKKRHERTAEMMRFNCF